MVRQVKKKPEKSKPKAKKTAIKPKPKAKEKLTPSAELEQDEHKTNGHNLGLEDKELSDDEDDLF